MLLSEYIQALQSMLKDHGNVPVVRAYEDEPSEPEFYEDSDGPLIIV
jgi:hypothetical protein